MDGRQVITINLSEFRIIMINIGSSIDEFLDPKVIILDRSVIYKSDLLKHWYGWSSSDNYKPIRVLNHYDQY